jgi:hypothetical protein
MNHFGGRMLFAVALLAGLVAALGREFRSGDYGAAAL